LNITELSVDPEKRSTAATQMLDGTHSLEAIEKEVILAALTASNGHKAEAARRLGAPAKPCTIS
jgi:transcriptional regulator with GAF, ATPase, and Fis domain